MNTNQRSQCDYCAFKLTEDQSTIETELRIEEKYKTLRNLIGVPKKTRNVFIGGDDDKTETCFINSPNWPLKKSTQTYCDDFMDESLSLETALSLREAIIANRTAKEANHASKINRIMSAIAIIIAVIVARADIISIAKCFIDKIKLVFP